MSDGDHLMDDWLPDRSGSDLAKAQSRCEKLESIIREIYFHLGPPQPQVDYEGVPALVEKATTERDQLMIDCEFLKGQAGGYRWRAEHAEAQRDLLREALIGLKSWHHQIQHGLKVPYEMRSAIATAVAALEPEDGP